MYVIALGLLLAIAAGLVAIRWHGQRLLSVQSDSMKPAFQEGDALIISPASPKELRPGDIISYQSPAESRLIISHRLVSLDHQTGLVVTTGDALGSHDQPFRKDLIVGKAQAVLPKFGCLMNGLRHPLGLALLIFLPAVIVISHEIKRLVYIFSAKL